MTLRERLRALVDASDPDGLITMRTSWLRDQLEADGMTTEPVPATDLTVDLTVGDAARLLGRGESNIRTWIGTGALQGCYKFHNREWRIPRHSIAALQEREARAHAQRSTPVAFEPAEAELSAWRKHLIKTG
jgi:hypothetical protein